MFALGLRVVRGPNWALGDEDGGEGAVGTVKGVGRPPETVTVLWDSGRITRCSVGLQAAYDLRLFDSGPVGVKHTNVICDGCKRQGIFGMRFNCVQCNDFDLCMICYFGDKHDLDHVFQRFDTPSEEVGVKLTPRKRSTRIPYRGLFVGATVVRGKDWNWKDQDGGEGTKGTLLEVTNRLDLTGRSVANVMWSNSNIHLYRLGHKGKVDIIALEPVVGGYYYRDHLPVLGKPASREEQTYQEHENKFSVGDKVRIIVEEENLRTLQEGRLGWNPQMADVIGLTGEIDRVTTLGDVRVVYPLGIRWTLNPSALGKLHELDVGNCVRVESDHETIRRLQQGHGEWTDDMAYIFGKLGTVIKVYSDGDIRVTIEGKTWTLNPLCVRPIPEYDVKPSNTMAANDEFLEYEESLLSTFLEEKLKISESMTSETLLKEAAKGRVEAVVAFLTTNPSEIDCRVDGKTCLQVASHKGHVKIVSWLLSAGASTALADAEGDTALHYSAFGNQPQVMEILIKAGADINAVNANLYSPLHISVSKRNRDCVNILLKHNCDVNLQDNCGDTALHDAIENGFNEIVDCLITIPALDVSLVNNTGFSFFHLAALNGNVNAVEKLLVRAGLMVNNKKDDGFAALHLACLNGHKKVTETLLKGGAQIDIANKRKQTPLMLAVSQGHAPVIELLVSHGADLTAVDEDGDTCLHLVLMKRDSISTEISKLEAPNIYEILQDIGGSNAYQITATAIACYLVQKGCSLEVRNNRGKTSLDIVEGTTLPQLLNKYLSKQLVKEISLRHQVDCCICSEPIGDRKVLRICTHRKSCEDCYSWLKKFLKPLKVRGEKFINDTNCIICKGQGVSGMRFKCTDLYNCDVCLACCFKEKE